MWSNWAEFARKLSLLLSVEGKILAIVAKLLLALHVCSNSNKVYLTTKYPSLKQDIFCCKFISQMFSSLITEQFVLMSNNYLHQRYYLL